MNVLFRYFKKADKTLNRIVIPKHLIEKYGREFYLEVLEDETIKLIPARKEK